MTGIIVTGVDGSETASQAARKAAVLAMSLDAELHVLSAFSVDITGTLRSSVSNPKPSVSAEAVKDLVSEKRENAEQVAMAVADELGRKHPGLRMTARAIEGNPGSVLVREAEALGAALIVVGNKRVQGVSRIFGSVARTVAREATCDLYIVHTHER